MEWTSTFKIVSDLMPRYDGNPKMLNHYIRSVEDVLHLISTEGVATNALVCVIKSRLSGAAIEAIMYEETLDSWDAIKSALMRRLGETRNEVQVMQELSRVRRLKAEDAEAFGKRLREMLGTLYSVGRHTDKSYYEQMVIEQYVNQLEFQVATGVRIARPVTLESAIVIARQEEARLAYNRGPLVNMPSTNIHQKAKADTFTPRFVPPTPRPPGFQPFQPTFSAPKPEQRQQFVENMLPWRRQQSGNFRQNPKPQFNFRQPNIPQQQINPPQKVSDVTMRSVNKPKPPQFASEELYYAPNEQPYEEGTSSACYYAPDMAYDAPDPQHEEVSDQQDFSQESASNDQS